MSFLNNMKTKSCVCKHVDTWGNQLFSVLALSACKVVNGERSISPLSVPPTLL